MKGTHLLPVAMFALACSVAAAGPFGLTKGMKTEDFPGGLEKAADFIYMAKSVPAPSEFVKDYILVFGTTQGLAKISCHTPTIATSVYGEEVISQFKRIESALVQKYGKADTLNFLSKGSIWNEPRDWMMGLKKGERTLMTAWPTNKRDKLPDDLKIISIRAVAIDNEKAYIVISYEFDNFAAVAEEIQKKRAGGL